MSPLRYIDVMEQWYSNYRGNGDETSNTVTKIGHFWKHSKISNAYKSVNIKMKLIKQINFENYIFCYVKRTQHLIILLCTVTLVSVRYFPVAVATE